MPEELDFRLRSLMYLLETARSETQLEAADNLRISQPALSMALDSLERTWGVDLFEKQGKKRVLTEAGRALVDFGAQTLGKSQELKSWFDSLQKGGVGTLRIGMTDSANLYVLPPALGRFADEYPQIELHLLVDSSEPLWEKLREFELDVAFIIYNPSRDSFLNKDFIIQEIMTEDLFLYVPESLDSETSPWALYLPGSQTRELIEEGLAQQSLNPNVTLESGNPQILSQMVNLGLSCSVLPEVVGGTALKHLKCQKIAERKLVSITRKSSPIDLRAQAFIEMARHVERLN